MKYKYLLFFLLLMSSCYIPKKVTENYYSKLESPMRSSFYEKLLLNPKTKEFDFFSSDSRIDQHAKGSYEVISRNKIHLNSSLKTYEIPIKFEVRNHDEEIKLTKVKVSLTVENDDTCRINYYLRINGNDDKRLNSFNETVLVDYAINSLQVFAKSNAHCIENENPKNYLYYSDYVDTLKSKLLHFNEQANSINISMNILEKYFRMLDFNELEVNFSSRRKIWWISTFSDSLKTKLYRD